MKTFRVGAEDDCLVVTGRGDGSGETCPLDVRYRGVLYLRRGWDVTETFGEAAVDVRRAVPVISGFPVSVLAVHREKEA